jgi:hypothetical protein
MGIASRLGLKSGLQYSSRGGPGKFARGVRHHLTEERLEEVVVAPIQERDANRARVSVNGGVEPAEAPPR